MKCTSFLTRKKLKLNLRIIPPKVLRRNPIPAVICFTNRECNE